MNQIETGFTNITVIGENDHGYRFAAGKLGDRWYGFVAGKISESKGMAFILPGCSEDEIDHLLPEISEEKDVMEMIIKRVGAVAAHYEHGYGGIARWFVEESLRGTVEEFLCPECDSVACSPEYHGDY